MRQTGRSESKRVFQRKKNVTGRQLARVNVVKYGETVWSELYPGNQHTVNCLQPAVEATESSLELAERHRQRTVWRFDGGAGSDEQFRWLLKRGYQVVGKGASNFRVSSNVARKRGNGSMVTTLVL